MTTLQKLAAGVGLGLCLMFAGCDVFGSDDPAPDSSTRLALDIPDTLYVGSEYSWEVNHKPLNALGPYIYTVRISGVLVDSMSLGDGTISTTLKWAARPRRDTLTMRVEHAKGVDSLVRVFEPDYLSGFAPIESLEVRVYEETEVTCCLPDGSTSRRRIKLVPLGAFGEGYRFEVERASIPDSLGNQTVYSRDTVRLRKRGNQVQRWRDTAWGEPGYDFPYFVQDTISQGLSANAARDGVTTGTIGASEYPNGQGTYRPGKGLIRYRHTFHIQMRGSSYRHIDLL